MTRKLTPRSSLDNLRREARRWLKALRDADPEARARLERAYPDAPAAPVLRDVQHALAREHGFAGWTALASEVVRIGAPATDAERDLAIQELLAAANRGDPAPVRDLLAAHPDIVNERAVLQGHDGKRTALHFAINSMNAEIVTLLLAHGADPNVRDEGDNAFPLHFVAERGDLAMVETLIEHGADPVGAGDYHELEVIGWATCFEPLHREVAEYLLAHGARHTIFSAVAMGVTAAIRDIAARSPADLDRAMDRTNHRRRPLHLAILKRQPGSLATLLELGADTEAQDAAGLTPLDQAALSGEHEMAARLIEHGARVGLPAAVALQRRDDIDRLLSEDPYWLRPGGRWERLIIRASETAPGEVIGTLIRAGASVHVRDDHRTSIDGAHGYTALHAAAWRGNADAARILLRHGADPAARESRYWSTPVGWANYAGHTAVRDLLLEGPIDIFDAIDYGRLDQIAAILARDPLALERPFGAYLTTGGELAPRPAQDPAWTPLAFAVVRGRSDAARLLMEQGADTSVRDSVSRSLEQIATACGHPDLAALLAERAAAPMDPRRTDAFRQEVAEFLRLACLDWHVGGSARTFCMHDAARLLERTPGIARADLYTAVVCGELDEVRRLLRDRPHAATAIGGPRSWPPLLYLCAARLPGTQWHEHAVEIAQVLLDHGADPNVFYPGGNADIHYTALTCVLGRGEEAASMHPRARDLARLLLERGADPHDNQVVYNVFADNTSRYLLDEDIVWLLELMHEHSVHRGQEKLWKDPSWPMFDLRGASSLGDEDRRHHGAHLMLSAAIDRNLPRLAEWMLAHGAGPNTPWGTHPGPSAKATLYQEALARGHQEMAQLLVRYGASAVPLALDGEEGFVDACLRMDHATAQRLAAEHPEYLRSHHALFAAVANDRHDTVTMLLDLGVSPDVENPSTPGERALHLAAAAGAERCAALLIQRGAAVDSRESNYGSVPLGWASYFQQSRMIELLGRHSRDVWALAHAGRTDRLREVLREEPALARVSTSEGHTPLMWLPDDAGAALEIALLLLEAGADPTRRNGEGLTAADIATKRGLDEVAEVLRARTR